MNTLKITLPVLKTLVVCERVILDSRTGSPSLIGLFNKLSAKSFPYRIAGCNMMVSVVDGRGNIPVNLSLVELSSQKLLWQTRGQILINDPLQPSDLFVSVPSVVFDAAGIYAFEVHVSGVLLGSHKVSVELVSEAENSSGINADS